VDLALVVPVRSFDLGKSRLSESLSPDQRERLARAMAEVVVDARHEVRTFVVCDDERIADWANERGATPIRVSAVGLNASLTEALPTIVRSGISHVAVCHADLPLATDLGSILTSAIRNAPEDSVLLAPDRHQDGTNVAVIPRRHLSRWQFCYGSDSFTAHSDLTETIGVPLTVVTDDRLATDVDTVDDLTLVRDFVATHLPEWTAP